MTPAKAIKIGSASIPLDNYVIAGTALLGTKASGKTYCAKGIAEQLLDHQIPIIVFDPIGRWRFMKIAGEDSKQPRGYKIVVAGGEQPDLPLTPASAAEIVRAAMRENIPLVLDLYDRKLSKADWRRIVQTCFRTILYENRGLRHLFLEETAEFCPQKVLDGETYAEVEKLVRMGGNASVGITLINQRAQEVNKAVLDLCDNLVLMRQRGSHAIEALEKWIDKLDPSSAKAIARAMPNMEAGEAWVFTGSTDAAAHVHTDPIRSFHPDRSRPQLTAAAEAARRADPAEFVERVAAQLPKIAEEAKANDPAELKRRIAALERQLNAKVPDAVAASREDLKAAEARGFEKGSAAARQQALKDAAAHLKTLRGALHRSVDGALAGGVEITGPAHPHIAIVTTHPAPEKLEPATRAALVETARMARRIVGSDGDAEIGTGGKRRILIALAQNPDGVNQRKLSILTDIARGGGTWRTYMAELRGRGLIEGGKDLIRITDAGLTALGEYAPLPTGQELIEYWRRRLGDSGKRAIFDAVVEAYPSAISKERVADRTSIAIGGGTWRTYMAELRGLEIIEGRDELRASEVLFQ